MEKEDMYDQSGQLDRCRACDEVMFTCKSQSNISLYIDSLLAQAQNALSLPKLVDIIYKKVERDRRKEIKKNPTSSVHPDVWPKKMIEKHLLNHMMRLDLQIKNIHEGLKRAEKFIESKIKKLDAETGGESLDYKAVDAYLKVQKAIKDNTQQNPSASYGYVSEDVPVIKKRRR
jgi:hypothetical protein